MHYRGRSHRVIAEYKREVILHSELLNVLAEVIFCFFSSQYLSAVLFKVLALGVIIL